MVDSIALIYVHPKYLFNTNVLRREEKVNKVRDFIKY